MRRIVLLLAVGALFPAPALAETNEPLEVEPTLAAPPPGSAPQSRGFVCEKIAGDPALESAAQETPPPVGPQGQKLARRTGPSACPTGMLAITTAQPGPPKKPGGPRASAEPFGDGPIAQVVNPEYYFYVGDIWQEKKIGYLSYRTQVSIPTVPAGSAPGAHSISQFALIGGGKHQYSIESGWIMERKDTEEGWLGSQAFFFVNPDNWEGEDDCYDCGLVLAEGVTESPFGKHWAPTDGSPHSECKKEGKLEKPCTALIRYAARQYKGAWWLWWNGNGGEWVGRVSDEMWGKHFSTGTEEQGYGEVYDTPEAPTTQMGNGNKGSCTCATEAQAVQIGFKATAKEPEPILTQQTFHNPIENESYPTKYTGGNFNAGRTTFHLGG